MGRQKEAKFTYMHEIRIPLSLKSPIQKYIRGKCECGYCECIRISIPHFMTAKMMMTPFFSQPGHLPTFCFIFYCPCVALLPNSAGVSLFRLTTALCLFLLHLFADVPLCPFMFYSHGFSQTNSASRVKC